MKSETKEKIETMSKQEKQEYKYWIHNRMKKISGTNPVAGYTVYMKNIQQYFNDDSIKENDISYIESKI